MWLFGLMKALMVKIARGSDHIFVINIDSSVEYAESWIRYRTDR